MRARADSGAPLQWMGTNCVALRLNTAGSDDVSFEEVQKAVGRITRMLSHAFEYCSYIDWLLLEPSETALPGYQPNGPNENVIYWVEQGWLHGAETVALTVMMKTTTGAILDADIILNGEDHTFSTNAAVGTRDIESTLAHELGHVLGLNHTCGVQGEDHEGKSVPDCSSASSAARAALMYPKSAAGEMRRAPHPDDVLGICSIYPRQQDPGVCAAIAEGCDCALDPRDTPAPVGLLLALFALLALTRWRDSVL